jgi:hypothetical protein
MQHTEIGAAKDDQRDPARDLGTNQSSTAVERAAGEAGGRRCHTLDSTVTASPVHEPSDSSLLWDAVRFMVRLLKQANALVGDADLAWHDHCRAAKKRARKIQFTRGRPNRVQLYGELITITRATLAYLQQASERLAVAGNSLIALCMLSSVTIGR